jgi:cell division protein FtsI (penicillin-binding protein 3)
VSAAAQGLVRLPVWRARFVLAALGLAFGVLAARSVYLQALKDRFPAGEGRRPLLARHRHTGYPRSRPRPQRRCTGGIDAGQVDLGDPGRRRAFAGAASQALRIVEPRFSGVGEEAWFVQGFRLPQAASVARYRACHCHARHSGRLPASRIPALLPGRRSYRARPGLHRRRRRGQEGVELAHEATLGGRPGSRRVIKDRLGHIVEDVESIRSAQDGVDLQLSIDGKLQSLAYSALKSAVETNRAKAGGIIVIDVRSGEILALANVPPSTRTTGRN